jgi:UDP-N-acetyl-D-mannosaminuronic acid dehydrogenase
VVEPYIDHLPDSIEKAELMGFQDARHLSAIHLMLVDHSLFKENRPSSDLIIDTRGIWL